MDISMLTALNSSLGAIKDIGGTLISIRDETKLATIRADLMAQLVTAREAMFAIQNERMELQEALAKAKDEIAKLEKRELEFDKYEQFEVTAGVWAYRTKGDSNDAVKSAPCCATCFQNKKLSPLQRKFKSLVAILACHECGAEITAGEKADFSAMSNRLAR